MSKYDIVCVKSCSNLHLSEQSNFDDVNVCNNRQQSVSKLMVFSHRLCRRTREVFGLRRFRVGMY